VSRWADTATHAGPTTAITERLAQRSVFFEPCGVNLSVRPFSVTANDLSGKPEGRQPPKGVGSVRMAIMDRRPGELAHPRVELPPVLPQLAGRVGDLQAGRDRTTIGHDYCVEKIS
jgi:hypothetical protein